MTLVKVNSNPSRRVVNRVSPFSNLFDAFFNNSFDFPGVDMFKAPAVNVSENGEGFKMELAAPGLNKEDFKINIDKNQLMISVAKESTEESKEDGKYTRREFNYSAFSRSFTLPKTIDRNAISATYENGVLSLTIPKKEEAKEEAREITIS